MLFILKWLKNRYGQQFDIRSGHKKDSYKKEYYKFLEIYSKNNDLQSDNDIYLFIEEYIDKINFSIPFYNENVENYNHFRKLPVNIIMAKIFKFYPATPIEF